MAHKTHVSLCQLFNYPYSPPLITNHLATLNGNVLLMRCPQANTTNPIALLIDSHLNTVSFHDSTVVYTCDTCRPTVCIEKFVFMLLFEKKLVVETMRNHTFFCFVVSRLVNFVFSLQTLHKSISLCFP